MIKISKQQEEQNINDNKIALANKEESLKKSANKKTELDLEKIQSETTKVDNIETSYGLVAEVHEIEKRENQVIKVLLIILCTLALVLGIGIYRFYPLIAKISGSWTYHENSIEYQLVNRGKESRFTILNLQDQKDVNLIFISQLKPVAANRYKAEETRVQIEIKKSDATIAGINALKKDQTNYRLVNETVNNICFSYTKSGVVTNFGDTDINRMFEYQISDFKFELFPTGLRLANKTFAYGGLKFVKD